MYPGVFYLDQDTCPLFPEVDQAIDQTRQVLCDALLRLTLLAWHRGRLRRDDTEPWTTGPLGRVDLANCSWWTWTQSWANTTCGWGGFGGQAITNAPVWVVYDWMHTNTALVYHGKLAYGLYRPNQAFMDCIANQNMPGPMAKRSHLIDRDGALISRDDPAWQIREAPHG